MLDYVRVITIFLIIIVSCLLTTFHDDDDDDDDDDDNATAALLRLLSRILSMLSGRNDLLTSLSSALSSTLDAIPVAA